MSRDDSFPTAVSEAGGAPSVLSSQMTDISEDGQADIAARAGRRPSGAGLPWGGNKTTQSPNSSPRPGTASTGEWARSPPSRSAGQRFSISGSSKGDGGPPSSSGSRTHAPSIMSHAFFRPMSSQRLQAQRGGPRTQTTSPLSGNESAAQRQSLASAPITGARASWEERGPPPSRGTEITDLDTVEHTNHTHMSMTSSERPLQRTQIATRNLTLNLDTYNPTNSEGRLGPAARPTNSPGSFRSSFLTPGTPKIPSAHGREKLSSQSSAPGQAKEAPHSKSRRTTKPGHNYQYFTGNTVFCWGGRLQNTRHRPINFATGFFVVLPGVLFFVFSAPWLWHNVSPAIPIIFAYLYYLCLSSFVHASLSDPGVSHHPLSPSRSRLTANRSSLAICMRCLLHRKAMTL